MAYFPSVNSYQRIYLSDNVQLDYPYSVTQGNIAVTDIIDVYVTTTNHRIFLTNATETTPGFSITFNNIGNKTFYLYLYDKQTLLTSVLAGSLITVYVTDVNDENGQWNVVKAGNGQSSISNIIFESTDQSIDITGTPVTSPSGTVNFSLDNIITKLKTLNNIEPGVLLFDRNKTDIWSSGSIVGDNNITVENYDGSAGSLIIVKLDPNVALTEITAGNVRINGNTITNTNVNNDLLLTSNGTTSKMNVNGVLIDKNRNLSNINDVIILGSFIAPNIPKSWCRFNNTSGSISVTAKFNVDTVVYNSSNNQYTINFIKPMGTTEYGVEINCSNNNSSPPLVPRIGQDIIRTTTSVTIVLINSSGEMLSDFPEGVTVTIYSLT